MARLIIQQIALKPQDLLILLALSARGAAATYADLAAQTGFAGSAVHASLSGPQRLASSDTKIGNLFR